MSLKFYGRERLWTEWPGKTNWMGKLCTGDLLIKAVCLVKKVIYVFNINSSWSKLASSMRSTEDSLGQFSYYLTWKEFATLEVALSLAMHLLYSDKKLPSLELKTWPKQLLGSFPLRYRALLKVALAGNTNWRGKHRTVDLLIKVACLVKMVKNIFYINS